MQSANNSLKTDLYELTMAAGYFLNKIELQAVFELFCYRNPVQRSYFIACGLEQVVDYILNLRFSDEEIDFLRSLPPFQSVSSEFFAYLKDFKFTGSLWAMPEGEIFFAHEPIVQIAAPIIEAQILETYLLSMMHIQTLVASKAARVVRAARSDGVDRGVVDFGSRRAHGPEAAALAARGAYIGGCLGTSNVYAARRFSIPAYGTMAHSWIEVFDEEEQSFLKYHEVFPENTVLLIDTYDTLKGARAAAGLKKDIRGVRLDSGDLIALSRKVRKILDERRLNQVKIVASGNLNEYKIRDLIRKKAPIDCFGVGTEMVTSKDAPALDLIYKLVQTEDKKGKIKYRAKLSQGKSTVPARKQVFRTYTPKGLFNKDIIGLFSERPAKDAQPLLEPVIENGQLVKPLAGIETIRKYVQERLARLPARCLSLDSARYLKTEFSPQIQRLIVAK